MATTPIRLDAEVAARTRTLARQLAAAADVSVTLSDAVGAAVTFALDRVPEVAAVLRRAEAVSGSE